MLLVHDFPCGSNPWGSGLQAHHLYDAICGHSAPAAQVHPVLGGKLSLFLERQTN